MITLQEDTIRLYIDQQKKEVLTQALLLSLVKPRFDLLFCRFACLE